MSTPHVSDSTLLAYVGEGLATNARERTEIRAHLHSCAECLELVVALTKGSERRSNLRRSMPVIGELVGGRFRIVRTLGSGAMGTVYEAFDEVLETPVAVKIFLASVETDEAGIDSIRREAAVGRRLQHPNIRRVFDLETAEGVTFLSMEMIEGETLEERLRRGPVPEKEAVAILTALTHGLEAAHDAGVVHRDLKPSNVAIESGGRVVVMDFGLARELHVGAEARPRQLVGTPAFWSPEQSRGEAATPASDIFSLGLIGHLLLTGQPFSLNAPVSLPKRHRRFLTGCLAQRPSERFRTAKEARRALWTGVRTWLAAPAAMIVAVSAAGVAPALPAPAPASHAEPAPLVAKDPLPTAPAPSPKAESQGGTAAPLAPPESKPKPARGAPKRPASPRAPASSAERAPIEAPKADLGAIDRQSPYARPAASPVP